MTDIPIELGDDSPDLTDEDVNAAVITSSVNSMIEHLKGVKCPECAGAVAPIHHELRRRAPFMYAKMVLKCMEGHTQKHVFRADWLQSSGSS